MIGGQSYAENNENEDLSIISGKEYQGNMNDINNMLNEASTFNCQNIQRADFSEMSMGKLDVES